MTQIATRALTHQIGIVRRRTDTNSLSSSTEEVAHAMSEIFEDVSRVLQGRLCWFLLMREDLIPDSKIVRGTSGSFDGSMGLQEEVPVSGLCHAAVDDGAILGVCALVSGCIGGGIEARVVAFADDDDRKPGEGFLGQSSRVCFCTRLFEKGEFFVDDGFILAFRDTVAVDDDVFRILFLVRAGPALKADFEHCV